MVKDKIDNEYRAKEKNPTIKTSKRKKKKKKSNEGQAKGKNPTMKVAKRNPTIKVIKREKIATKAEQKTKNSAVKTGT